MSNKQNVFWVLIGVAHWDIDSTPKWLFEQNHLYRGAHRSLLNPTLFAIGMKGILYGLKVRIVTAIRSFNSRAGKKLCYKCNRLAVSVDHVPPKTIFIDSRMNLQTVPSCKIHNADQSNDDEFLKNILTMHFQSGPKGTKAFKGTVIRSISRHLRHYAPLINSSRRVLVDDQIMGRFQYDYGQFHRAISKIADGIHFLENRKPYIGNWVVYNLSGFPSSNDQAEALHHSQLIELVKMAEWQEMTYFQNKTDFLAHKLFEEGQRKFSYLLTFYSNIWILVLSNFEKIQGFKS